MNKIAKAVFGACLTLIGMGGLYFGIEYSGWVLFVGLLVSFSVA